MQKAAFDLKGVWMKIDSFSVWGREREQFISRALGTKYSRTLEDKAPPQDSIRLVSVYGQVR